MTALLPHMLNESVRRFPERISVRCGDAEITYAELDARSSRLATLLQEIGVGPGVRVALYLRKSIESIVSIFGVLKTGAAYVPLDPFSPKGRAAYILNDCGVKHLLTTSERLANFAQGLPPDASINLEHIVLLDVDKIVLGKTFSSVDIVGNNRVRAASVDYKQPAIRASDLAYILYTSGSTGVPKGVMISHGASLHFVDWACNAFGITETDIVSNHAPLHFDLSILDVFATIKAGAKMVLVPAQLSTFPVKLSQFVAAEGITIWYSVPSALTLMLQRGKFAEQKYPDLRMILFAGEVFPVKYLRQVRQATRARLFNLYGPTETNVCTYYEVDAIAEDRVAPFPIGKAIGDYDLVVVDAEGNIADQSGVEGELYAAGPGLMSGYWGDEDKTERSMANLGAFAAPRGPFYRTGDIVVRTEGGDFVYKGRRDHMVKSRGYRIELGEIETALHAHPDIAEAVVVPVPDEEITHRLHAIVVPQARTEIKQSDLRDFCRSRLPTYMVPHEIDIRRALPKTSTGKIDRSALADELMPERTPG